MQFIKSNQVDIYLINPKYLAYFHLGVWQWHPGIKNGIEKLPVFQEGILNIKISFTKYDDQTTETSCIRDGDRHKEGIEPHITISQELTCFWFTRTLLSFTECFTNVDLHGMNCSTPWSWSLYGRYQKSLKYDKCSPENYKNYTEMLLRNYMLHLGPNCYGKLLMESLAV